MKLKKQFTAIPYSKILMAGAFGALVSGTDIDEYRDAFLPEELESMSYSDFRANLNDGSVTKILINKESGTADISQKKGVHIDFGADFIKRYNVTLPENFDPEIILNQSPKTQIAYTDNSWSGRDFALIGQALALLYGGSLTAQWIGSALGNARQALKKPTGEAKNNKKKTAYHEAGHAVVGTVLAGHSSLNYVTAIADNDYLGLASFHDREKNSSKTQYINNIAMILAGAAAENIIYKEHESGIIADFSQANSEAHHMVKQLGMGQRTGLRTHNDNIIIRKGHKLRHVLAHFTNQRISDQSLREIENDVKDILDQSMALARTTIQDNRAALDEVAEKLMLKDRLSGAEVKEIVERHSTNLYISDEIQTPQVASLE